MDSKKVIFVAIAFCVGFMIGGLFLGFRVETRTGNQSVPASDMFIATDPAAEKLIASEEINMLVVRRTILFDPFRTSLGGLAVGSILGFIAFLVKESYPDITYRKILVTRWCKNIFWLLMYIVTFFAVIIGGHIAVYSSGKVNVSNVIHCWQSVVVFLAIVMPVILIAGRFHYSPLFTGLRDFLAMGVFMFVKSKRIRRSQKQVAWWALVFLLFGVLFPPWTAYKSCTETPTGEIIDKLEPVFAGFHYYGSYYGPDFGVAYDINHKLRNKIFLAMSAIFGLLFICEMIVSQIVYIRRRS